VINGNAREYDLDELDESMNGFEEEEDLPTDSYF
jgi:hypothetical protein